MRLNCALVTSCNGVVGQAAAEARRRGRVCPRRCVRLFSVREGGREREGQPPPGARASAPLGRGAACRRAPHLLRGAKCVPAAGDGAFSHPHPAAWQGLSCGSLQPRVLSYCLSSC